MTLHEGHSLVLCRRYGAARKSIWRIQPGEEITCDYVREYVDLLFRAGCQCTTCRTR
jgi:hypothetical protein